MTLHLRNLLLAGAVAGLAACGGVGKQSEAPENWKDRNIKEQGKITDFIDFGGGGSATGDSLTPVNSYLWRASLDTLSYLPLVSTDPFTGVIATDWAASPEAPGERFKVASRITSPELTASAVQVAVYREVRDKNGAWVTAPVSGETARKMEDAILLRARQLQIADREGNG